MPATKLNMNISSVTVTPATGSAIVLDGVMSANVDRGGTPKVAWGDALKFARAIKSTNQTRSLSVTSYNCFALNAVPVNTICGVVIVYDDLTNGAAAGAITVTAINAVMRDRPFGGSNNEYAMATYDWDCFGGAGDTDPITVTQA